MKILRNLSLAMCAALTIASCTKHESLTPKEVAENVKSSDVEITHNYIYNGKDHSVKLLFNEKNELVDCNGDVQVHQNIMNEKNGANKAFLVESISEDQKTFNIRIFDNLEKMHEYHSQQVELTPMDQAKACTHWSNEGQGTANYLFYQHTNYQSEYAFLGRWNVTYFQWWGFAHANDQISSVALWGINGHGAVLDLFEHTCFSGHTIRLTSSVANLHHLVFMYDTQVIRDPVTLLWEEVVVPIGHWGDKASSAKGWYTN